jgi:hypothetical protein
VGGAGAGEEVFGLLVPRPSGLAVATMARTSTVQGDERPLARLDRSGAPDNAVDGELVELRLQLFLESH